MTSAPTPVPAVLPGEVPLALLVDFDGTIAQGDVTAAVILASLPHGRRLPWEEDAEASWPEMMTQAAGRFAADPAPLLGAAASQPLDRTFTALAALARRVGVAVEVVSDGFGFFIEPALERLDAAWVPIASGATTFAPHVAFPFGDPSCHVCGTCKRNRVRAHQAAGRRVAFVGDGESDRYAAAYADVVFAKDDLVDICASIGVASLPWRTFDDVRAWLDAQLAALASDPSSLPGPDPHPLICGAEVWGPGRRHPPDAAEAGSRDPRA
jgi:2-hydroxy-3-keto-5-methylthiopentenyl-1-phosphate phosphatase